MIIQWLRWKTRKNTLKFHKLNAKKIYVSNRKQHVIVCWLSSRRFVLSLRFVSSTYFFFALSCFLNAFLCFFFAFLCSFITFLCFSSVIFFSCTRCRNFASLNKILDAIKSKCSSHDFIYDFIDCSHTPFFSFLFVAIKRWEISELIIHFWCDENLIDSAIHKASFKAIIY